MPYGYAELLQVPTEELRRNRRMQNSVAWLMNDEWCEAVDGLLDLTSELDVLRLKRTSFVRTHSHLSNFNLLLAIWAYQRNDELETFGKYGNCEIPNKEWTDFGTYMTASYGFVVLTVLGLIDCSSAVSISRKAESMNHADELGIFEAHRHENIEIVHASDYFAKLGSPKHFIVVNHTKKHIVLSVRGTASLHDIMTDLACSCDELLVMGKSLMIHSGVLQGARAVQEESSESFHECIDKHPSYEIIVTGHSLGGAVAAVICLLLLAETTHPVKCFTYGAPPFCSLSPVEQQEQFPEIFSNIITLVNTWDVIPRLSLWGANRMMHKLERLDALSRSGVLSRWSRFKAIVGGLRWLSDSQLKAVLEAVDIEHENGSHCTRLYQFGQVVHMVGQGHNTPSRFYTCNRDGIADIRFDYLGTFIFNHIPTEYHRNLISK